MGSHGLCTQTQVRLENPRLRRKDCIVLFPVIFSKGVIGSKGHIRSFLIMSIYFITFSVWFFLYKQAFSLFRSRSGV
jgi:hypothetical protein